MEDVKNIRGEPLQQLQLIYCDLVTQYLKGEGWAVDGFTGILEVDNTDVVFFFVYLGGGQLQVLMPIMRETLLEKMPAKKIYKEARKVGRLLNRAIWKAMG